MALTTETALRKDRNTGKASMEHRHFATIAAIITELADDIRPSVAHVFARELADTNPRFDRKRFLAACDV